MSLQGQWASEAHPQALSEDGTSTTKQTKTNEITEEEDFTGNAQLRSGETREDDSHKRDINDL